MLWAAVTLRLHVVQQALLSMRSVAAIWRIGDGSKSRFRDSEIHRNFNPVGDL
jgi:hypothetical protein